MEGTIFDIQYGAIYDGPGLRTCVFCKGCPLRCRWCQNPEAQHPQPQLSFLAERCLTCGECVKFCPENALEIRNGLPVRDAGRCRLCGACTEVCSPGAREIIGYAITTEELLEKARRDRPFYESSGGGVTLSGGEPTMQQKFLLHTLQAFQKEKIHTAVETCGYFQAAIIKDLLEVADLILFDIKHMDAHLHQKYTGITNELIQNNFTEIIRQGGPDKLIPRIPLIPGFNADEAFASRLARYLQTAGYSGEVHLMPYNSLTKTKWAKIGRSNEYRNFGELTEEVIAQFTGLLEAKGFTVICNR